MLGKESFSTHQVCDKLAMRNPCLYYTTSNLECLAILSGIVTHVDLTHHTHTLVCEHSSVLMQASSEGLG